MESCCLQDYLFHFELKSVGWRMSALQEKLNACDNSMCIGLILASLYHYASFVPT